MDRTFAWRLAVGLALGLIVGVERGWQSRRTAEGLRSAGVRTFAFVGLFGALAAILAGELGAAILGVAFLGLAGMVVASYVLVARETQDYGTTTELALLLTFGLGALAGLGFPAPALGAAVVTALLLGFKQELHRSLERLERRELSATLQLLVIAAVALPLLPDRDLGPWQALNPRTIGLLVLLIAGISYVGYFAVRLFGERVGLLLTAALGGLTSSTAVTVAFARMARQGQGSPRLLAAGIALAAGMMAPRLLFEVGVVNRALVPDLAAPLLLLAALPLLAAWAIARHGRHAAPEAKLELRNPLELWSALAYGAVLSVLFVLLRGAEAWLGAAGVYGLSALSGVADVDAVGISLAETSARGLPASVATTGIVTAALTNTAAKAVLAALIGGWALARWCGPILGAALAASLAVWLWR